ncbi:cytoskeletal protein RodZ [Lysinibacillus sp. TE18511]
MVSENNISKKDNKKKIWMIMGYIQGIVLVTLLLIYVFWSK